MTLEDEMFLDTINQLTETVSNRLLEDFLKLPDDLQKNVVLVKVAELLLANILCHIATDKKELDEIIEQQVVEMKELIADCAATGFAHKFSSSTH